MADKKKKTLGEYIQVEMAKGVPVTIERKNMSDAEWSRVKNNAREAGTLVEDLTGDKVPASEEDQKRIEAMSHKIEKNRRDKFDRENPDFKDLQPEASNEPGMSVRANMQRLATGATPSSEENGEKNNSPREESGENHEKTRTLPEMDLSERSPHDNGTRVMPEMDISPTNEITQEQVDAFESKKNLEKVVKDNESAAQMKDGLDFTTPESRLSAAVNKRAGEPPSYTDVTDNGDTQVTGSITSDPGTVIAKPPLKFGGDSASLAAAGEGIDNNAPAAGQPSINFDGGMGNSNNPVARMLLPQTTAAENYVPGSNTDGGVPAPAKPVTFPPGPGMAGTSPKPGPGGSVSLKVKTSGGAGGTLPTPEQAVDYRKAMEHASATEQAAVGKRADIEQQRALSEAQILADKIKFTADNENQRLAAVKTYDDTLAHGQQSLNAIMDERRSLMNQKVDPDAYYTKGGIGRAVLSTISGAMFGYVGQGPQFLQRMDNLAQQEVKNQQDELSRKSGELDKLAGDQRNVIAMGQARGLNAMQSIAAAKASFFESVEDQLKKVVAESPTFAAQAAEKIAQLEQKKIGYLSEMQTANQMEAHRKVAEAQNQQKLNLMSRQMELKAAGAGAKKGRAVSPTLAARVSDLKQLVLTLGQMEDLAKNGGFLDRMKRSGEEALTSDEAGKLDAYKAKQFEVARLRAGSSLQKPEQEALLPLTRERSGRFDAVPGIQQARKMAEQALKLELANTKEAGDGTMGGMGDSEGPAEDSAEPGEEPITFE